MGKIYYSPYTSYQYIVRPRRDIYEGGVRVGEVRELLAEFALHRPEYTYQDKDGNQQSAPDISGHFFDLDSQAEQKEWDGEEKALVEKRLDRACREFPSEISLHTKTPVPLPWATYDETNLKDIAQLAQATGSVDAALAYERENKNRKGVIASLEALIVEEQVEELTAA